MFQYQLCIKSAKLLSALISLNDVQSTELRQTEYVANGGMSLSICKWHAYCWNALFPAHFVIPAVSIIDICKYVYCLCYVFVMVVTFNP